jgi:hypothetical protein
VEPGGAERFERYKRFFGRIAACLNACAGIQTLNLEKAARGELHVVLLGSPQQAASASFSPTTPNPKDTNP